MDHPKPDGNKRRIEADAQELLDFSLWIVHSPARHKEEAVRATEEFLKHPPAKLAE